MWISTAYAQAARSQGGEFNMMSILPLTLIVVVFYLLLIRPRRRGMKLKPSVVEAMVTEVREWFSHVNKTREFTLYRPQRAMLRQDEFATLCGETDLLELVKPSNRYYIGTRVRVGKLPIYLGRSASGNKEWTRTDRREVVVSNRRFSYSLAAAVN